MREYPREHYLRTGDPRASKRVYCTDALERDGRGLCGACLFRDEDEDGEPKCGWDRTGDGICPFLELDPRTGGYETRRIVRR